MENLIQGAMANESELSSNDSNASFSWDYEYLMPLEDYDIYGSGGNIVIGWIFMISIIVGVATNVLGLASLVRFRMWLKHEGYVYLVAIFAANIGALLFESTTHCILYWNWSYYPPHSSAFMCKFWHFFRSMYFAVGWLSVALLFNVYLREHLTQRRRCGCPNFAAKYCTLFASKIVVGIIFGVNFMFGLPYVAINRMHDDSEHGSYCSNHEHFKFAFWLYRLRIGLMCVLPFVLFLPVILLLTLCLSRNGNQFGFSSIEERSLAAEQFRAAAVTLSSTNLFSYVLMVILNQVIYLSHVLVVAVEIAIPFSTGLQPVFCFIILKEFRIEILRKLRDRGCCKCLPQRCWPSGDGLSVRLQDVEEDAEEQ